MWVVDIHTYDYFTGNKTEQYKYDSEEEAVKRFIREKPKDFDYGNHYRTTKMFEIGGD